MKQQGIKECGKCKEICEGIEGQSYLEMTGVMSIKGKLEPIKSQKSYYHVSCIGKEMPNEKM